MDSSNELLAQLLERTGSSAESASGSEDHIFLNLADIGTISPSEHESESSSAPSESSICDQEEERRLSQLMDRRNIHSDATDSPGSSTDSATNIRLSRLKRKRLHSSSSCSSTSGSNRLQISGVQLPAHEPSYDTLADRNSESEESLDVNESGIEHQEGDTNHTSPNGWYSNFQDPEEGRGARLQGNSESSSSGDEIPYPLAQGRERTPRISNLSSSSDDLSEIEGGVDGPQLTNQDADRRLDGSCPIDEGSSFDYRSKLLPLSAQEIRSFVIHDITVTHHVPREAAQSFASLHTDDPPFDPRTTKKRLESVTGLKEVLYDCCKEGCISYALPKYASLTECPINSCRYPRYKADGRPHAQHSYIPIAHRLRLMYSDKERAREMMTYRAMVDREMKTTVWTIEMHKIKSHRAYTRWPCWIVNLVTNILLR